MLAGRVERRFRFSGRSVAWGLLAFNTLFVVAALLLYAVRYPALNWDMIPYTALTIGGESAAAVHDATFGSLAQRLPAPVYEKLTSDRPYREAVARDPQVLQNILPFYAPRPLYLLATRALAGLGTEPYRATWYVPFLGMLVATFLTLRAARGSPHVLLMALAPWCILAGDGIEIARSATPDGLAFPFTMLMFFGFLWPAAAWARLAPALVSIAVRHDLVLLVGLVYVLAAGLRIVRWREALLACVASGVLAAAIAWWFDYPGWRILFYHSFVETLTEPGAGAPPLSVADYLATVARFLIGLLNDPAFWLRALLVACLLVVGTLGEDPHAARATLLLVGATVAFFAVRSVIYPLDEGRVYGALVTLNALWLLRALDGLAGPGLWWRCLLASLPRAWR